tara:strand:- start:279 stop:2624 length:2346 start_codon:yes stop_codon:yes gene_type:complete
MSSIGGSSMAASGKSRAPPQSRAKRGPGQSVMKGSKGGPSTKMSMAGRAKGVPGGEHAAPLVIVRDDLGNDVTPKSLLGSAAELHPFNPAMEETGGSNEQSSSLEASKNAVGLNSSMGSVDGGGDSLLGRTNEKIDEDTVVAEQGDAFEAKEAPEAQEEAVVVRLSATQLEEPVVMELRETETFWLLELAGTCVAMDSPAAPIVSAQNAAYEALLKARGDMADMFTSSSAQTFNDDTKQKEVQTTPLPVAEMGTQATIWDIWDAQNGSETEADRDRRSSSVGAAEGAAADAEAPPPASHGGSGVMGASGGGSSFSASASGAAGMSSSFTEPGASAAASVGAGEGAPSAASPLHGGEAAEVDLVNGDVKGLKGLPAALRVLERMVTQNSFQTQHLAYRNIAPNGTALCATPPTAPPDLKHLWGFRCEDTRGRNVSGLEWNPANTDLLAVSYGQFDFSDQRDGLILFWTLKNPAMPDKVIHTPCGVTSIAFSAAHPNLLAAGMYDGTVCIFDIRKDTSKPTLESGHTTGKHTDPVWQVKWVDHGPERGEALVSISTDGRVTQWSMKKGLEHADLMVLKRVTAPNVQEEAGIISRRASGLCFDFCVTDSTMYVAGTEDGHIHKCSVSYNEQHLENYFGHSGPVYKLRWSPFDANTFLSASADWSVKLWNQERPNAVFTFQSTTDYVSDICWSPTNATVFASVTGDGLVEVWDVSANTLDPLKSVATGKPRSCVAFAKTSPILVTGDNDGTVDVYQLVGSLAEENHRTAQEQAAAIEKVTMASNK